MKKILRAILDTAQNWLRVLIILAVVGLLAGVFSMDAAFQAHLQPVSLLGIAWIAAAVGLILAAPALSRRLKEKKGIETELPLKLAGVILCGIGAIIAIYG